MRKKSVFVLMLGFVISSFGMAVEVISLSDEVYQNQHMPLIENKDYLVVQVPFSPVEKVYDELLRKYPKLIHRGEAHITVLTPPEFKEFQGTTIQQINQLAKERKIQSCEFQVSGLGHGKLKTTDDENFFLVVVSECLVNFRRELSQRFKPLHFDPNQYYPHITIGFTHRDLHEQDGVIKDKNSFDPNYKIKIVTK